MYDWIRREDTKYLLHHNSMTPKSSTLSSRFPSSHSCNKHTNTSNNKDTVPKSIEQNYRSSSINECLRPLEQDTSPLSLLHPQTRTNKTFSHQSIFSEDQIDSDAKTPKIAIRTSSTFSSHNIKQVHSNSSDSLSPPKTSKSRKNNLNSNSSSNSSAQNILSHDYSQKQLMKSPHQVKTNRNRNTPIDSQLFLPSSPKQPRFNQHKIKDHSSSDLFGEDISISTKSDTMTQTNSNNTNSNNQISMKITSIQPSNEIDNNRRNGDKENPSSNEQTLQVKQKKNVSIQILSNSDNFSTSEARSIQSTKSVREQQQSIQQSELASGCSHSINRAISLTRLEEKSSDTKPNDQQTFLNNRKFAEQQKLKQIKSHLFDEINTQIFGGQMITQDQIALPSTIRSQWQYDASNEGQRRQDCLFSDIFASETSNIKTNSKPQKARTPLDQRRFSNQSSINTPIPSENRSDSRLTSESRFYSNLSSAMDRKGYQNNIKKDSTYKIQANVKFEKNRLVDQETNDLSTTLVNSVKGRQSKTGGQQMQQQQKAVVELNLSNFSENFDQRAFESHCASSGIHLVDLKFEYNKINQQCRGTGSVKIRGCDVDSSQLLGIKQYLRNQGLVVSNHSTTKPSISTASTSSSHKSEQPNTRSLFQSIKKQKLIEENNKKEIKRSSTTEKNSGQQKNQREASLQSDKKMSVYSCEPSEIDSAKKLVEQLKWNSTINLISKQANLKKELQAKKISLSKRPQTPAHI